jgi:hypothetical protein
MSIGGTPDATLYGTFKDVTLPAGNVLMPGLIAHSTNVVEHLDLVAERLLRYADIVGRDSVMAGTDCRFSQSPLAVLTRRLAVPLTRQRQSHLSAQPHFGGRAGRSHQIHSLFASCVRTQSNSHRVHDRAHSPSLVPYERTHYRL